MSDLISKVKNTFPGRKVVILGDLVADQFLSGAITRVSREAPVFIMRHEHTETRPGGGANAAANVAALGGTALLVGVCGDDENGRHLQDSLTSMGVSCERIVANPGGATTTKIRVIAGQNYSPKQQVIRIDFENENSFSTEIHKKLSGHLATAVNDADAIVISDYGYGAVTQELYAEARRLAAQFDIPLVVDSRFRLRDFVGATSATPNQEEVEKLLGPNFSDADCQRLCRELGLHSLLVTCGNKGIIVFDPQVEPFRVPAIGSTEPVDVTGAGDTVIAAYTLGLASGLTSRDAAVIANHAGGVVVMKKGTATVFTDELVSSLAGSGHKAAATDSPA